MIKQDQKISLKIGHELLEKLEQLSVKNDRTLSSMIRIILKEYVEKVETAANE
jgi:predicted DNA-binding protein